MFRKLTLALAATAALGTASLAISSTPAEAKKGGHHHHHGHFHKGGHWHKHHHHHWRSFGVYRPAFTGVYASCYVKRWVPTPFGYYKLRWVNICL